MNACSGRWSGFVLALYVASSASLTFAQDEADAEQDPNAVAMEIMTGGAGSPTPPPGSINQEESEGLGSFRSSLLFESIGEDYFLTLDLFNELSIGPVGLALHVPLRFRVLDKDPANEGVMRQEDWDEVSDFARLIHYLELTFSGDDWHFQARYGAFSGESLGHGTIVGGYYNTVDFDHYQGGLSFDVAIKYGGLEFMLDNLFDPEIFGFRFHLRPLTFFSDAEWASRLAIGFSYAADTHAPVALADATPNSGMFEAVFDDDNNFGFTSTDLVGVFGIDLEYTVLQNSLVDLVPYADFNVLIDGGTSTGVHLGAFFNVRVPGPVGPEILTRLEYRIVTQGYAPRYIDSLYEAQRVMYRPEDVLDGTDENIPLTKLGWLRTQDSGVHGWLGELYFNFADYVRIGGTFEDYQGPDNGAITLVLQLPELGPVSAAAFFYNRGVDGFKDIFDLDGAMLLASLAIDIYGPLYIQASYTRKWRAVPPDGRYETDNNWNVGFGLSFDY